MTARSSHRSKAVNAARFDAKCDRHAARARAPGSQPWYAAKTTDDTAWGRWRRGGSLEGRCESGDLSSGTVQRLIGAYLRISVSGIRLVVG